jgi:hypothetical protein
MLQECESFAAKNTFTSGLYRTLLDAPQPDLELMKQAKRISLKQLAGDLCNTGIAYD